MSHIIFVTDIIVPGLQHVFIVGRKIIASAEKQMDIRIQIHGLLGSRNVMIGNITA